MKIGALRLIGRIALAVLAVIGALLISVGMELAFAAPSQPVRVSRIAADIRPASTWVDARVLAANVAETVTVPTFSGDRSRLVILFFSSTCSNFFYNASGGTAAAPAADVTDGSASGRAPTALKFKQASTFSLVADATCTVTMEASID